MSTSRARPTVNLAPWLIGAVFVAAPLLYALLHVLSPTGWSAGSVAGMIGGWLFLAGPLLVLSVPVGYLVERRRLRPQLSRWRRNQIQLTQAYYCRRDDVAFHPGGPADLPERFTLWQLSQP